MLHGGEKTECENIKVIDESWKIQMFFNVLLA